MRVLGVDWGGTRIGLAVGETEFGIATPRPPLSAQGALKKDAVLIDSFAKSEEVEQIVVGLPLNDDDDRASRVCSLLAGHLRDLGWRVSLVDESMTSVMGHADLREEGLTGAQRRKVIDGESARRILLRFFEEHGK